MKLLIILISIELATSLNIKRNEFNITENGSIQILTVNQTINEDLFKKKLEYFRDLINFYYLPLIVTIGMIGNMLTIIILSRENSLINYYDETLSFRENLKIKFQKQMENKINSTNSNKITRTNTLNKKSRYYKSHFSSTNYFIFSLAISDLIYNLILGCVWITRLGTNLLNINYICQISILISYICSFLSAAFTTLFTFQRFIAVVYPLKSATTFSLQSKHVVRRVILILFIFSLIAYSFSLFLHDTSPKKDHEQATEAQQICGIKENYANLVFIIDNTFDSFLTLIIPSISILIMNFAICKSLSKYQKTNLFNKKKPVSNTTNNPSETYNLSTIGKETSMFSNITEAKSVFECSHDVIYKNSDRLEVPLINKNGQIIIKKKLDQNANKESNSSRHVTKTLLIVSFAFILLNSPYRASKLISYINMTIKKTYIYSNFDFVLNEVLINLYFTSYSVNFFLYSLCGRKFRASLKSLLFHFVFVPYYRFRIFFNFISKNLNEQN